MSRSAVLRRLADICGIEAEYVDYAGVCRHTGDATREKLLLALGLPLAGADDELAALAEALATQDWRRPLPPVWVLRVAADNGGEDRAEAFAVALTLPASRLTAPASADWQWSIVLENGERLAGAFRPEALPLLAQRSIDGVEFQRRRLALPPLAPGYHRLELASVAAGEAGAAAEGAEPADITRAATCLIVAPARCYCPAALHGEARTWGPTVQLYSLRSQRNWGIGDFSDLAAVVDLAAAAGAGMVGVNPLHALFPEQAARCSPYSPSSRLFLNVLYIDVEAVADFQASAAARALVASAAFQARLQRLRAAELVDYAEVAAAKQEALRLAFAHFCDHDLTQGSGRAQAFQRFCTDGGEALRQQAVFDALQAHFYAAEAAVWGWPAWPAAFRSPAAAAVRAYAAEHGAEVDFYRYLQWLADEQLAAATRCAVSITAGITADKTADKTAVKAAAENALENAPADRRQTAPARALPIGLYQDLALGIDPGGAEAWGGQGCYAQGAHLGAPPDDFSLGGQDWGLLPLIPQRLREAAYAPFIATLRTAMRHAGALRIDHVMALQHVFWIPAGEPAAAGAYLSYPFADLLAILALESQRQRCLVIGEDLGTVPDGFRPALAACGVLSYRPLFFARGSEGGFLPPAAYPRQALAVVGTHDMPTLCGFWLGSDIDARAALGLFPAPAQLEAAVVARAEDRVRLLLALQREGLLPDGVGVQAVDVPAMTAEMAQAVHAYLARSPAMIVGVQVEDIFGVREQANLPGTTAPYPNWRRRLPLPLEAWADDPRWPALAGMLQRERGGAAQRPPATAAAPRPATPPATSPAAAEAPAPRGASAAIPRATYRLQLNRDFTLAQATAIVPYLAELGISHCYLSPCLKARPGSSHGYDIVDYNAFNPELGSADDFRHLARTLQAHGMGLILDIVPNHMGVMGDMGVDNAWWLDVLENGPASAYADYFDIDWQPPDPALRGKLLLPILDEHYGTVLDRGELQLAFAADRGEFSLHYRQHRLPIDPAEYPRLIGQRRERDFEHLKRTLGPDDERLLELQSLAAAFGHLPARDETAPAKVAERQRDKEVLKRHLAALCAAVPAVAAHIAASIAQFNGGNGEPGDGAAEVPAREPPLASGGAARFDALHALIKAQAYRLAYWRVAADEINYRRFFDQSDLAALRMENPAVFAASHRLLLAQVQAGLVQGLRIDHADGLYDPAQYFRRLQAWAGGGEGEGGEASQVPRRRRSLPLYLVVEKILGERERLPEDWPIHGDTGYGFAQLVNGLFVDCAAEQRMSRIYAAFTGCRTPFATVAHDAKRLIIRSALAGELNVLASQLARIAAASRHTCDFTLNGLRTALAEVVACFPVYRSYFAAGRLARQDRRLLEGAVALAKRRSPAADISVFDFVYAVLSGDLASGKDEADRRQVWTCAMKFQQYTAPVMAKGVEDTAFYRYHRLVSLNDVGGNPGRFGTTLAAFHTISRSRAERWPHALLAGSTHDSKRAEDVRARIDLLSEIPSAWKLSLNRWRRINRSRKRLVDGQPAPSANDEYLLYQTLIGTWPLGAIDDDALADYRQRIRRYLLKAVREAKEHSSWINVNEDYEAAVAAFVEALLAPGENNAFLADFAPAARRLAPFGLLNSLAQTLIRLTAPGVPDIYQGCELWQFNLVDPDNRRPIDYELRRRLLAEVRTMATRWQTTPWPGTADDGGRSKLYLIWRALQLRRRWPEVFRDGEYLALPASGRDAAHVCAYARRRGERTAITVVPRLAVKRQGGRGGVAVDGPPGWADTRLALPRAGGEAAWFNVLSGERLLPVGDAASPEAPPYLTLDGLLAHFPVALLAQGPEAVGQENGDEPG